MELVGCTLTGNEANHNYGMTADDGDRSRGGGIFAANAALELTDCVIADNTASVGGGLSLTNTVCVLDGCVLTGNRAVPAVSDQYALSTGIGGAMYVETEGAIPISVYNSSIHGNTAAKGYGSVYGFYNEDYAGLLSQGFGKLDLYFCTVTDNTCLTSYEPADPDSVIWYTRPGDVWRTPYVTAFGCVLREAWYAPGTAELPTEENGFNYYGNGELTFSDDGHLRCHRWEVPAAAALEVLGNRYPLTRFWVGSNYDAALYREAPAQDNPTVPPETAAPTEPAAAEQPPKASYLWYLIPGVLLAAVVLALLLPRRTSPKPAAAEEPAREKIIMTRYTREQIDEIMACLPETQRLTPRELEVFQEMLMGRKQGEIAYTLGISVSTVKDNARRIYNKLEVENKAALFIKATDALP